ncbi:MAG: gfo/Idh/MocA family oxidoreductase, partial [Nitrospirae bacterium]
MVKVGVIGVGYLGQHHARIYSELKGVELVGVADIDEKRVSEIAKKYSCRAYTNYYELLKEVEAVSIVVPTVHHYAVAIDAINENIDILVEKPITSTIDEAEILIREADKKNLILQVGHLERFNSALMELSKKVKNPIFIESQRISPFLGRGIDVDVVVDLMVHD